MNFTRDQFLKAKNADPLAAWTLIEHHGKQDHYWLEHDDAREFLLRAAGDMPVHELPPLEDGDRVCVTKEMLENLSSNEIHGLPAMRVFDSEREKLRSVLLYESHGNPRRLVASEKARLNFQRGLSLTIKLSGRPSQDAIVVHPVMPRASDNRRLEFGAQMRVWLVKSRVLDVIHLDDPTSWKSKSIFEIHGFTTRPIPPHSVRECPMLPEEQSLKMQAAWGNAGKRHSELATEFSQLPEDAAEKRQRLSSEMIGCLQTRDEMAERMALEQTAFVANDPEQPKWLRMMASCVYALNSGMMWDSASARIIDVAKAERVRDFSVDGGELRYMESEFRKALRQRHPDISELEILTITERAMNYMFSKRVGGFNEDAAWKYIDENIAFERRNQVRKWVELLQNRPLTASHPLVSIPGTVSQKDPSVSRANDKKLAKMLKTRAGCDQVIGEMAALFACPRMAKPEAGRAPARTRPPVEEESETIHFKR